MPGTLTGPAVVTLLAALTLLARGVAAQPAAAPATGAPADEAHFHHVQLNVTDAAASQSFYEEFFGAVPVELPGTTPAVWVERSLLLFNEVDTPPDATLDTSIWHIGWGGRNGPAEFQWFRERGARFQTELTPLGDQHYFYVLGPDGEVAEVFTGEQHHRFNHVHLFTRDVDTLAAWFERNLGLEPRRPAPARPFPMGGEPTTANSFRVDGVGILLFSSPTPESPQSWVPESVDLTDLRPTKDRVIDHLGFSFRDIDPVYERMRASGARLEGPIAHRADLGTRSFFVVAPDGLRLQILERIPFPEAIWE